MVDDDNRLLKARCREVSLLYLERRVDGVDGFPQGTEGVRIC